MPRKQHAKILRHGMHIVIAAARMDIFVSLPGNVTELPPCDDPVVLREAGALNDPGVVFLPCMRFAVQLLKRGPVPEQAVALIARDHRVLHQPQLAVRVLLAAI